MNVLNCRSISTFTQRGILAGAVALAASASFLVRPLSAGQPAYRHPAVQTETVERTVPLPSGGAFSLININGSVVVEGWDREEVHISAVKSCAAGWTNMASVSIEVVKEPRSVTVRTRYPDGEGEGVSVEFHVRVPRRLLQARVSTVNGSVRLRAVEGAGELRSVNGNVELFDGAGRFSARSVNGNIYLELRHLGFGDGARPEGNTDGMFVETVNGTVVLRIPANAAADLDVRAVNGDFRSDLPIERNGAAGGRGVRGRLGAGGQALKIRTMNGGIRLLLAQPIV